MATKTYRVVPETSTASGIDFDADGTKEISLDGTQIDFDTTGDATFDLRMKESGSDGIRLITEGSQMFIDVESGHGADFGWGSEAVFHDYMRVDSNGQTFVTGNSTRLTITDGAVTAVGNIVTQGQFRVNDSNIIIAEEDTNNMLVQATNEIRLDAGAGVVFDGDDDGTDEASVTSSGLNITAGFSLNIGVFDDSSRGAFGTSGRMIFNTDDGNLNIDTGTDWILPDGTST